MTVHVVSNPASDDRSLAGRQDAAALRAAAAQPTAEENR